MQTEQESNWPPRYLAVALTYSFHVRRKALGNRGEGSTTMSPEKALG